MRPVGAAAAQVGGLSPNFAVSGRLLQPRMLQLSEPELIAFRLCRQLMHLRCGLLSRISPEYGNLSKKNASFKNGEKWRAWLAVAAVDLR